tara:strand:+ start:356 stop:604 length:249 start_codon:yes stop_codon:yes gene_type:complete
VLIRFFKGLWRREKAFLHGILKLQNWILMALVYVLAVAPVAILLKLFRHEMLDKSLPDPEAKSYWVEKTDGPLTLERARKRF